MVQAHPLDVYHINGTTRLQQIGASATQQQAAIALSLNNAQDIGSLIDFYSASLTQRMCLARSELKAEIANHCNATVILTQYYCQARNSIPATAHSPIDVWQSGLTAMGALSTDYLKYGVTPFEAKKFTKYYKVTKVKKVTMRPATMRTIYLKFKGPKLFEDYDVSEGVSATSLYKWTKWVLLVAHTYPCNDSTTKTQVATGNFGLDVMYTIKFHMCTIDQDTNSLTIVNTGITYPTVANRTQILGAPAETGQNVTAL
jgi:hypothetical protein